MKKKVERLSVQKVRRRFPKADLLEGWFFRVLEVSVGHFEAEGTDLWGRTVYRSGPDGDLVLEACVDDARSIVRHLSASE